MIRRMIFQSLVLFASYQWMTHLVAQQKVFLPTIHRAVEPGTLCAIDPIVGNLRCVPTGTFIQGTPATEPGGEANRNFIRKDRRQIKGVFHEVFKRRCRPRNDSWAELMRRVFSADLLRCHRCGGRMRIRAAINPPKPSAKSWTVSACLPDLRR